MSGSGDTLVWRWGTDAGSRNSARHAELTGLAWNTRTTLFRVKTPGSCQDAKQGFTCIRLGRFSNSHFLL
jgi:hypothetical protein